MGRRACPVVYSDFDSAWKDALHAQIDWRRAPVFLDKKLQALLRSRRRGRRHVDKLVSVRRLYGWGYDRDNIVQLFRIIDALVGLPQVLEPAFDDVVIQIEEETQMAYVTSIERVRLRRERGEGQQEGLQQGMHEKAIGVLSAQITRKFGYLPDWALQILDAQHIEGVFA